MFERYTEKARRVIFFARYEASEYGSPYIETEHLLLGLLREDKTVANRFLGSNTSVDSIRDQIASHTTTRQKVPASVDLPMSQASKRILAYGCEESDRLGHQHIGTEHLLVGILKEEKSFAAALLHERGLQLPTVRQQLQDEPRDESRAPEGPRPIDWRDPDSIAGTGGRQATKPIAFERFTAPAMRAALLAYQEASELGSPAIDVEHLLLGVLREDTLEATRFLRSEAALESIRREIEAESPAGEEFPADADLVLSHEYLSALRFASAESERLGHEEIKTGHLLLGILHEEDSLAVAILNERGYILSAVRDELTGE